MSFRWPNIINILRITFSRVSLLSGLRTYHTSESVGAKSKMPKPKSKEVVKVSKAGAESKQQTDEAVFQNADNSFTIRILAKPGAKQTSVTVVGQNEIGVSIAAPPVDGEANAALVKYLSRVLGLRKSDVSLDKGSKSRTKNIIVCTSISKEEIIEKLTSEIDR